MTRRERFRAFIAHVSPSADPALAIQDGLYIDPPTAVSTPLASHLELEPNSVHLVVGSVGAGKTTELLMTARKLSEHEDIRAVYVDVGVCVDIDKLQAGCLIAAAARALHESEPEISAALPNLPAWFITPVRTEDMERATAALGEAGRTLVVLLDSLDRTNDLDGFTKLVEFDVAELRRCGVGVVLVGPIRSLRGFGRLDADRFDRVHVQAPIDVLNDLRGREFLTDVIRKRASRVDPHPVHGAILTEGAIDRLVPLCGGVLRDLISLAKASAEEAYIAGAEIIDVDAVMIAADTFGRSLMAGLDRDEIARLREANEAGNFIQTSQQDLALILTRRVLQYPRPSIRYAVHPTIAPLLSQMGPNA